MIRNELLKGLSQEQIKKVANCHTTKELLELAAEENIELTAEQLEAVSGGECQERWVISECPRCHYMVTNDDGNECRHFTCIQCNIEWTI